VSGPSRRRRGRGPACPPSTHPVPARSRRRQRRPPPSHPPRPSPSLNRCLQVLEISGAPRLKDAHIAPLAARAGTLRELALPGCSGVGAKGAAAKAGAAVATLAALTRLRRLDLSRTGLGAGRLQLRDLGPALAGLTSLGLGGLQLGDAACAGLGGLTALRELDLAGAEVSDGFVEGALGGLTQLTALRMPWCSARALPLFGSLRVLDVSHCVLEGVAHSQHGGEVRLRQLRCGGCDVRELAALALPAVVRCAGAGRAQQR
jgi:hypothetical protein